MSNNDYSIITLYLLIGVPLWGSDLPLHHLSIYVSVEWWVSNVFIEFNLILLLFILMFKCHRSGDRSLFKLGSVCFWPLSFKHLFIFWHNNLLQTDLNAQITQGVSLPFSESLFLEIKSECLVSWEMYTAIDISIYITL